MEKQLTMEEKIEALENETGYAKEEYPELITLASYIDCYGDESKWIEFYIPQLCGKDLETQVNVHSLVNTLYQRYGGIKLHHYDDGDTKVSFSYPVLQIDIEALIEGLKSIEIGECLDYETLNDWTWDLILNEVELIKNKPELEDYDVYEIQDALADVGEEHNGYWWYDMDSLIGRLEEIKREEKAV